MPTFDVSSASPTEAPAEVLVIPVYEGRKPGPGVEALQAAFDGDLVRTLADHNFNGKVGETFTLPSFGRLRAKSVLVVGVGKQGDADAGTLRRVAMKVGRQAARFRSVATTLPQLASSDEGARAFAEGLTLGLYRFDRYKQEQPDGDGKPRLERAIALADGADSKALKEAARRGQVYADAANWARDLVNTPAIDATPDYLAEEARAMASRLGLTCKIWTKAELRRGGFGGILGVGAGSVNEPRLIELAYRGAGAAQPIGLTGKGVTFDSGGLSIKDAAGMEWMKADMGGAAAALATMRALAELQPRVNVIAAIPSAENLPGGSAIRPGDVLRHRGGKTSEVLNTDAEGRLILADALAYLVEKNPRVIIDSATLTGAAMIALGQEVWAVMGNDRALIDGLLAAGREEGEPGWELPLWPEYRRHLDSTVADVKNIGIRWGGAITAGLFLKEFVGDVPWAHLDVAGTAFSEQGGEYWPRGATGSPARTFIRYIESQAEQDGGPARARRSTRTASSSRASASTRRRVASSGAKARRSAKR